ncbi:alpha-keto acid decarboxylase family protein [Gluconacetobacter azotocaptans]|uniref:pyruvate decarboxylase n=1 Tax=Gluconacetobacter azotocaptans TaxID=142834 RepID=A0A7W4PCE8_9PROT|nr:thiamine pyrophosphate-dependent enzyme [Gluconacetobacter azotocaptans]MBB2188565.1 alpha-keto acid decarboxylase family protein [Gluconacetobacter azotocaptans]MBM9400270.1 alpha-keto acid decarboxylase family protein [Gluconacetobacter azotocaptans]GBQ28150.1 pyruvate decarboxylase [Gluconacetobacter azotocaptans DSM 13594]
MTYTVGMYLGDRLKQIGLDHHFAVAGDYNLVLLDQLLKIDGMDQVYCCNELNCGYSAEGYARAKGAGAAIVTFSVGAISAFNAVGGAYAENLPLILISGAPNSNDHGSGHILHHTIGTPDYTYQIEMARRITCAAVSIISADEAPAKIDHAIRTALRERKPAYIEIACNVAGAACARPGPVSAVLSQVPSDAATLEAAVEAIAAFLAKREKVAILVGSKLRAANGGEGAVALADALGCAVATMAAAKSFFPENYPNYIGTYWGEASSPGAREIFDWADGILCLGCVFNDYSTVGWTAWPRGANVVQADIGTVTLDGQVFDGLHLKDLLTALAARLAGQPKKGATMTEYRRIVGAPASVDSAAPTAKLTRAEMARQIGALLTPETTLLAETGDSWFNAMRMKLPEGARVEFEMQWGHIGWSVPATFGYAVAEPKRRIITMVGDGSFQLTAQEVAQMVRRGLPVIVFLVNNHGYTIEVEIHDGPYNNIKNWDYAGLIEVFNAGEGKGRGFRATTGAEMAEAVRAALDNHGGPTLIECVIDRDDCTSELISWGRRVASANARPPAK